MQRTAALGRVVHLCIGKTADGDPVLRPANIVRVWDVESGKVNVVVHVDGTNDRDALIRSGLIDAKQKSMGCSLWVTSVEPREEGTPVQPRQYVWPSY